MTQTHLYSAVICVISFLSCVFMLWFKITLKCAPVFIDAKETQNCEDDWDYFSADVMFT